MPLHGSVLSLRAIKFINIFCTGQNRNFKSGFVEFCSWCQFTLLDHGSLYDFIRCQFILTRFETCMKVRLSFLTHKPTWRFLFHFNVVHFSYSHFCLIYKDFLYSYLCAFWLCTTSRLYLQLVLVYFISRILVSNLSKKTWIHYSILLFLQSFVPCFASFFIPYKECMVNILLFPRDDKFHILHK